MRLQTPHFGPVHFCADAPHFAVVHDGMCKRMVFQQVLEFIVVQRMVDDRGQAFLDIRPFPVPDGVDQQIAQGLSVEMQPAEYIEHLPAQSLPCVVQFLE